MRYRQVARRLGQQSQTYKQFMETVHRVRVPSQKTVRDLTPKLVKKMRLKKIISFGFKHGNVPASTQDVKVLDVRELFVNPYHSLELRAKTGLDEKVQQFIERGPEFQARYDFVKQQATTPGPEVVYIGCQGGHHRSVFIAEKLAKELGVEVEHREL